jgi:hypothetical protein
MIKKKSKLHSNTIETNELQIYQKQEEKLNRKLLITLYFLTPSFLINNANADTLDDFTEAIRDLTTKIESAAPVFFVFGFVFILASLVAYILFPKLRHVLGWIFGVIGGIVLLAVFLEVCSDPIKNMLHNTLNIFQLIPKV